MEINYQNKKIPELSVYVFTSNCKVVDIEDMSNTQDINKSSLEVDIEKIKNKNNK